MSPSPAAARPRTVRGAAGVAAAGLVLALSTVVPGEAFGTPGYLRLSYALGDDDLHEGATRIANLLAETQ